MRPSVFFVVAPGDVEGHEHVRRLFGKRPEVEIVCDRRRGERRAPDPYRLVKVERRRQERRVRQCSLEVAERDWAHVRRPEGAASFWPHKVGRLVDAPQYAYYRRSTSPLTVPRRRQAAALSQAISHPSLKDPQYLVLRERSRILSQWVETLPNAGLRVLDVGGRLQPYRPVLETRLASYIAIDPVFEGLLDVVALGEHLPFPSERFDVVLCTQALNYAADPFRVIAEIHRVLRPGGACLLSVPVWCLVARELDVLLAPFSSPQIVPEGSSAAGLLSVFNLLLEKALAGRGWRVDKLLSSVVFPVTNLVGRTVEPLWRSVRFTTNHCCLAFK